MENKDFKISFKTVWFLVIGNILLTVIGTYAKILHWDSSPIFLTLGLMLFFSSWVLIFNDMVKNKIYNRTIWIMSMFFLPFLPIVFYMLRRNRLIRLGDNSQV